MKKLISFSIVGICLFACVMVVKADLSNQSFVISSERDLVHSKESWYGKNTPVISLYNKKYDNGTADVLLETKGLFGYKVKGTRRIESGNIISETIMFTNAGKNDYCFGFQWRNGGTIGFDYNTYSTNI